MTIKHNCENNGCYVKTQTPDWSFLDGVFDNENIKVGDIDGAVEINGYLLILEWKGLQKQGIPTGQSLMFNRITKRSDIMVFVITGDPKTSVPESLVIFHKGEILDDLVVDTEYLKKLVKAWETKALEETL